MLFSGVTFLYFFLPAVVLVYALTPQRFRNLMLLAASVLFYFAGEPAYTVLLLGAALMGYLFALYIAARRGTPAAKRALVASIVLHLGVLGFFKYADFFMRILNAALHTQLPLPGIALPIGISFFTFQTMSYTIDVYRGQVKAQGSFVKLATYVCLFPQLIAGPIVRYSDIAGALDRRETTRASARSGTRRFIVGLAKKVLIANTMGEICVAFRTSGEHNVLFYWLYAIAFTMQVYFDFSGYSDMAIGLGRLFGFEFPENFDYPYLARSVTEFWRRWHMTLGGWFRDYVYIPLGGSRAGPWRWVRNLAVVWALTGLWHGADWNFVLWGGYCGMLLLAEKLLLRGRTAPRPIAHGYTFIAMVIGFVIFNADGMHGVAADLAGLLGLAGGGMAGPQALYTLRNYAVPLVLALVGCTPAVRNAAVRLAETKRGGIAAAWAEPFLLVTLLLCVNAFLVNGSFNPFLYLRF